MSSPSVASDIRRASTAGVESSRPHPVETAPGSRLTIILCFFAIYVIWGSTYLAIRYAVETIPPLYAAGIRHLTAGSILLLWCVAKKIKPTWAQMRASVIIGTLFFLLGHGSLHWAQQRVPSGLASLLVATEPIMVFFLAAAVAKKFRFNWMLLSGVFLGLAGVGILVWKSTVAAGPGMLVSSLAVLFGALSWSGGIVYSRNSKLSGHPLLLSALSSLSGATLLLLAATVLGEWRDFSIRAITLRSWEALAYLIIFGSVITFSAYNWLLERYPPTLVATHTYVNPIVAVLLGWMLAGERVSLNLGLAAAMVIGAVILVDRGTAPTGAKQ